MRQYVLLFSLLVTGVAASKASLQADKTDSSADGVLCHRSDRTPLEWTVYTPRGVAMDRGPRHSRRIVFGGDSSNAGVTTCAQDLADAGYIAFAINHRLAPPGSIPGQHSLGRFPDQYDDVHLAVQAARDDARTPAK